MAEGDPATKKAAAREEPAAFPVSVVQRGSVAGKGQAARHAVVRKAASRKGNPPEPRAG
jgi:hypothetical protein